MNIKKLVRKSLIIVTVLFSLYGAYNLYKICTSKDVYNVSYVSGTVIDKFESAYSCGKRSVCYKRYLTINGVSQSVNLDTYLKARINHNIYLVIKEKQPNDYSLLAIISSGFTLTMFGMLLLLGLSKFIDWLLED